jgi:hypothetical protein
MADPILSSNRGIRAFGIQNGPSAEREREKLTRVNAMEIPLRIPSAFALVVSRLLAIIVPISAALSHGIINHKSGISSIISPGLLLLLYVHCIVWTFVTCPYHTF